MAKLEYNGLGAEWLRPILEIEQQQDEKRLSQENVPDVESHVVSMRCDRTIDMFSDLEDNRRE